MIRGMSVSVYRNSDPYFAACTKSGRITGQVHTVFLMMPENNGPETLEDNQRREQPLPVMRLVKRKIRVLGQEFERVSAIPNEVEGDGTGRWCFSGNFIFSSDSRFAALNNGCPIPCHDAEVS